LRDALFQMGGGKSARKEKGGPFPKWPLPNGNP